MWTVNYFIKLDDKTIRNFKKFHHSRFFYPQIKKGENELALRVRFGVAHLLARQREPVTNGELI